MKDDAAVAPELRAGLRRFPTVALHRRPVLAFARAATRFMPAVRVDGVEIEDVTEGHLRLRVLRPTGRPSASGLLWIHGGGLVAGSPCMDDELMGETVRALGIVVVAVDYRRAPEHPFPAPLDDCLDAWLWLNSNADRLGVHAGRIAVGGESAGGGLAAALVQRLHDGVHPRPRAQWLMCPMLDDRTAARADIDDRAHRVWNNRNNRFGWRSYLGSEPGAATAAQYAVAARRADLTGLPPTWIGIAGLDLFADEDLDYARRLQEAGVPTEVDLVEGAPHGFQTWGSGTRLVDAYLDRARSWLDRALVPIDRQEPS